jgi:hypothetical protein
VQTFTLEDHGDQVLVLAMEPSKLLGYRDSHILFQKHPQLKRVRISDDERQHLIDTGLLITRFKNPEVAVVTARSLFKCFGHKVITRGRRIKDDYYEEPLETVTSNSNRHFGGGNSKEAATEEEEIRDNSRKSLIGKTSRSEGYSSQVPISNQTWMHHAALAARGFNAQLHERRAGKPTFYDIHSNINQVPASYQSTICHFEFVKSQQQSMVVEFKKKSNIHNTPIYRGLGKGLLDYDVESAINSLSSEEEKEQAKNLLVTEENILITKDGDDENYPLALMEGQYESGFPM